MWVRCRIGVPRVSSERECAQNDKLACPRTRPTKRRRTYPRSPARERLLTGIEAGWPVVEYMAMDCLVLVWMA